MKLRILASIGMLLLMTTAVEANATEPEVQFGPRVPSPGLMQALMAFAAPQLDLPVPDELPKIIRRDHCGLQAIAFPGFECSDIGLGVLALYGPGVIWLRDDWSSNNLRDVSILLHELVHHMQHHAGVPETPCRAEAIEKPAYDVQFAFLRAAKVDPYKTIGIGPLTHLLATNCMGRSY